MATKKRVFAIWGFALLVLASASALEIGTCYKLSRELSPSRSDAIGAYSLFPVSSFDFIPRVSVYWLQSVTFSSTTGQAGKTTSNAFIEPVLEIDYRLVEKMNFSFFITHILGGTVPTTNTVFSNVLFSGVGLGIRIVAAEHFPVSLDLTSQYLSINTKSELATAISNPNLSFTLSVGYVK